MKSNKNPPIVRNDSDNNIVQKEGFLFKTEIFTAKHNIVEASDKKRFALLSELSTKEWSYFGKHFSGFAIGITPSTIDSDKSSQSKAKEILLGEGNTGKVGIAKQALHREQHKGNKYVGDFLIVKYTANKSKLNIAKREFEFNQNILKNKNSLNNLYVLLESINVGDDIVRTFAQIQNLGDGEKNIPRLEKLKSKQKQLTQVHIAESVLFSLKQLHDENVFHRDIKPDNFLFSNTNKNKDAQIKLSDFGAAIYRPNAGAYFEVSNNSSRQYWIPELLIAPAIKKLITKKQNESEYGDSWATGLTLLQFSGVDLKPYFDFLRPTIEALKEEKPSQLTYEDIKNQLKPLIAQVTNPATRQVISDLLNIENRKTVREVYTEWQKQKNYKELLKASKKEARNAFSNLVKESKKELKVYKEKYEKMTKDQRKEEAAAQRAKSAAKKEDYHARPVINNDPNHYGDLKPSVAAGQPLESVPAADYHSQPAIHHPTTYAPINSAAAAAEVPLSQDEVNAAQLPPAIASVAEQAQPLPQETGKAKLPDPIDLKKLEEEKKLPPNIDQLPPGSAPTTINDLLNGTKIKQIVSEFLVTEMSFRNNMKNLVEYFYNKDGQFNENALQFKTKKSAEFREKMHSQLKELLEPYKNLTSNPFTELQNDPTHTEKNLLHILDYIEKQFANDQPHRQAFEKILIDNKQMVKFWQICTAEEVDWKNLKNFMNIRCNLQLDAPDCTIQPVQRLPRYELLLKDIENNIGPVIDDNNLKNRIINTQNQMKNVTTSINNKISNSVLELTIKSSKPIIEELVAYTKKNSFSEDENKLLTQFIKDLNDFNNNTNPEIKATQLGAKARKLSLKLESSDKKLAKILNRLSRALYGNPVAEEKKSFSFEDVAAVKIAKEKLKTITATFKIERKPENNMLTLEETIQALTNLSKEITNSQQVIQNIISKAAPKPRNRFGFFETFGNKVKSSKPENAADKINHKKN